MLVGRAAELDRIDALVATARMGRAGALVLRGEPGIGKTTLLEWAEGRAEDFRVLRAVGVESEAELACAGLHQLLRPLLGQLDSLPAPQARALRAALAIDTAATTDRFAVYAGTLGLLAAGAEEGRLLCVIDDAQWLDTVSAEALVFAARRLDAEPIAMLFATRADSVRFVAAGVPELELQRLDEQASEALLAASGRSIRTAPSRTLLRIADGNPLALVELPRSLTDEQLLGSVAVDQPMHVTAAIQSTFLARVGELSVAGRRALLLAAASETGVIGTSVAPETAGGLAEAEAAGLVSLEAGVVRFRHPLVRAAAYQSATGTERRDVHAELAAAFDDEADEHAWHLAAAAAGADERVATLLERSADRAGRRGSMAARARALAKAAELTPSNHARARRLLAAARAAFAAGQGTSARALLLQAEEVVDTPILRADAWFLRWDTESAAWNQLFPSFVHAAEAVASDDPRRAARMFAYATDYLWDAGRFEESEALNARACELAGLAAGHDLIRTIVDRAWWALIRMQCVDAVEAAEQALALGAESVDPDDQTVLAYGALVLVFSEHPSARAVLDSLVQRARDAGAFPFLCGALVGRCRLEIKAGRLLAAYGTAVEGFAIGEVLGGWRLAQSALSLGWAEAYLGRDAECRDHIALARAHMPSDGKWWSALAHRALGMLALGRGDIETAVHDLEQASTLVPLEHPEIFGVDVDYVEALLRAGRQHDGLTRLADLEQRASRAGLERTLAAAGRCRLLVVPDTELDAEAAQILARLEAGSPFELARGRLMYGERLRRAGRRVDARRELDAARADFDRLGAEPWAAHARRELLASGARLRRHQPGAAEVLTPQELQIALAVAEGRTNREVAAAMFISPKTVEVHLSRVYRKLRIRSRAELIRLRAADTLPSRSGDSEDTDRTPALPAEAAGHHHPR